MKILVDSHILVWLISDVAKIDKALIKILSDASNEVYVSQVSLIELAIKQRIGKLSPDVDFSKEAKGADIEVANIPDGALMVYKNLPTLSWKDPFDHLLIAHAIDGNLIFCTADQNIIESNIEKLTLIDAGSKK